MLCQLTYFGSVRLFNAVSLAAVGRQAKGRADWDDLAGIRFGNQSTVFSTVVAVALSSSRSVLQWL